MTLNYCGDDEKMTHDSGQFLRIAHLSRAKSSERKGKNEKELSGNLQCINIE